MELLDGEGFGAEAVATAKANARGEWAMSLDKPLQPGARQQALLRSLRAVGEDVRMKARKGLAVGRTAAECTRASI